VFPQETGSIVSRSSIQQKIMLSPTEAAEKIGIQVTPAQVRLNSFDGRPVYRFTGGGGRGRGGGEGNGGRGRGGSRMIYADTGEEQTVVSSDMLDRIASAWTGRPLAEAKKESVEEVDQWSVAGQLRNLRPMYKYSWPNGERVYLNGINGEVVQYTTFGKRLAAHVSAIPHWIYYTPLRKNQPVWLEFMIYASLIGTVGAIIGIVKKASPDANVVETKVINQYDLYYLDRTRQRPLPVFLALMNDADKTRYYIGPKTARVVTTYSNRNWVGRWLYNGLHSLNFPWLYNYRPLWDIVVITFMVGGTALCVSHWCWHGGC
jgi:hypothetical protein